MHDRCVVLYSLGKPTVFFLLSAIFLPQNFAKPGQISQTAPNNTIFAQTASQSISSPPPCPIPLSPSYQPLIHQKDEKPFSFSSVCIPPYSGSFGQLLDLEDVATYTYHEEI